LKASLFIARKIYRTREGEKSVSPPAIRVATVSMALGLAVMLLAVAIVVGFKKEVRNKVIGFGSHIQISNFDNNNSYETHPIVVDDSLAEFILSFPNIASIEQFATKPGMIKTDSESQAVIFKGIGAEYDFSFFAKNLIDGQIPVYRSDSTSTQVIISQTIAKRLNIRLGDSFVSYFVNEEDVRLRKFTVSGIYNTGFSDYDKIFILCDIRQIRRLNGWDADMAGGLEVRVRDYDRLDETAENLNYELHLRHDAQGNTLYVRSIKQLNPPLFAWLDVLDMNVWVILALMLLVAGFSMISGLLIIILERANMIGVLKTLGQSNAEIRKTFLYVSAYLIARGLLWGNIIALSICLIQKYLGVLKLNPEVYYLTEVPIDLNIISIAAINLITFLITLSALVAPSWIIANISPARTVRFE